MENSHSIISLPREFEEFIQTKALTPNDLVSPQALAARAELLVDNGVFTDKAEAEDFMRMWFAVVGSGSVSPENRKWIDAVAAVYAAKRARDIAASAARVKVREFAECEARLEDLKWTVDQQKSYVRSLDEYVSKQEGLYFQLHVGRNALILGDRWFAASDFALKILGAQLGAKFIREKVLPGLEAQLNSTELNYRRLLKDKEKKTSSPQPN